MVKRVDIAEFLRLSQQLAVLDVRAPVEFARAHVLRAINLPLFTDAERAEIGTLYKKKGNKEAVLRGLELVGPKMRRLVEDAQRLTKSDEVLLHCWRGGMRSGSMAWLLSTAGMKVHVLNGGYRTYRRYVHSIIDKERDYLVLGGKTGSGKTEVLQGLRELGEQVIDLEGIANHRGSAFGGIGQGEQPMTEMFENILAEELAKLDSNKRIWLEDESRMIGNVFLPDAIYNGIRAANVIAIEVNNDQRIKRLVEDYGNTDRAELATAINKIGKRLGGQHVQAALAALEEGDLAKVAQITLVYYDKAYTFGLNKRQPEQVLQLDLQEYQKEEHPKLILEHVNRNSRQI